MIKVFRATIGNAFMIIIVYMMLFVPVMLIQLGYQEMIKMFSPEIWDKRDVYQGIVALISTIIHVPSSFVFFGSAVYICRFVIRRKITDLITCLIFSTLSAALILGIGLYPMYSMVGPLFQTHWIWALEDLFMLVPMIALTVYLVWNENFWENFFNKKTKETNI